MTTAHTRIVLRACARRLAGAPLTLAALLVAMAACTALAGCGGGGSSEGDDDESRKDFAPPQCALRPELCK